MKPPPLQFPARLVEKTDAIGQLLRESLEEPSILPSEIGSWHGLVKKRERPSPRLGISPGFGLAVASACAVALLCWVHFDQSRTRFSASPEVISPVTGPSALEPPRVAAAAVPPPENALRSRRAPTTRIEGKGHPSGAVPRNESAGGSAEGGISDTASDARDTTADCSEMVRKGHLEGAAECYGRIAQGNTMASELALYEKARLESRALGRGAAALATLDEHARRFPSGVLSTEVGLTRIELLTRLRRTTDALKAIETALRGPIGNERGGDLYALRGELLSSRGDCAAATAAFALARSHGVPPSRPLAGEKRCAEHTDTKDSVTNTTP